MTRLQWGILGPGRIAPRLVRAVRGSDRGEVAAVASRDLARAQAFADTHGIARVHGSYEALLDDPGVDAVYVSVPNSLHPEWTIRALQAGKHVLCEKPLATTVEAVDAIIAASRRTGRLAVEAFMYLHHPQTVRAIELARAGALGPLELVHGTFTFFLTHPDDPRIDPDLGGGSLWDVGCYPVSLARWIAGEEPADVGAFARFDERGVDRTFLGQLRFPGGLLAQFDCGFAAPDRERVEIVGGDATLVLEAPFLPDPEGPPPSLALWRGRDATPIDVPTVDQYAVQAAAFTAAVLDGATPRPTLESSRGNVAALVALDQAARGAAVAAPA